MIEDAPSAQGTFELTTGDTTATFFDAPLSISPALARRPRFIAMPALTYEFAVALVRHKLINT